MTFLFKQIDGADLPEDLLNQIAALRLDVWKSAATSLHKTSPNSWISDYDHTNRHFLSFSDDQLVAASRLDIANAVEALVDAEAITTCFPDWRPNPPIGFLKSLVVHPTARSQGLARKHDTERINFATLKKCKIIIGAAVSWRQASLARLGFNLVGKIPASLNQYVDEDWYLMEMKIPNKNKRASR